MNLKIRKEEYTALADFVKVSFTRDQAAILARFPKLNAAFMNDFSTLLDEVKTLESGIVLTEEQKSITASLYTEASLLNKELNFLSNYIKSAGLSSSAVTELKNDLTKNNIEGAILKIESVKQYVIANEVALVDEGMASNFSTTLDNYKTSLSDKNTLQNNYMNSRKTLTETNKAKYNELYTYITKIAKSGKLVFDGTNVKDEYTITKTVGRMRAAKAAASSTNKTS
jgi:hypothetical protein